jgi:hypothetical protein
VTQALARSRLRWECLDEWEWWADSQSPIADGYHAIPLAFSFANSYEAVLLVHVVKLQMQELDTAQSAGVENLKHGAIAEAKQLSHIWPAQQ